MRKYILKMSKRSYKEIISHNYKETFVFNVGLKPLKTHFPFFSHFIETILFDGQIRIENGYG